MTEVTIKSYGKINLSPDISGIREDGYHIVDTVMQKISLCDEVSVRWKPSKEKNIKIELQSNKSFLPKDERNIAYKAAAFMSENFAEKVGGGKLEIYLQKYIPVSAGLAGGSGNGAAVITALNRLWNINVGARELCRIGSKIGADVPFCILTQNSRYGCALGEGTGADITVIKSKFKKAVMLVKPSFGVSTKEVYEGIDNCNIQIRPKTTTLIEGLIHNNRQVVYDNMVNVLETYTLNKYQEVNNIKNKIIEETAAEKVLMTGSGPTVFGLFSNIDQARQGCEHMRKQGYEAYWAKML